MTYTFVHQGGAADDVTGGASVEVVFDPLDVDYVRRQCRQAEETERRVLEEHVTVTVAFEV
ncbi:hypothetical protein DPMN_007839 [Dreissena polymorpha]|uniref:Uncharacterized protein n=1 Tax=Dreissena polymorpha TaxID=45954 RepID=A0A9D4MXP8_DREPO|nr:hypothetical protein DPMN_007839 [Dreissena polymorpha]